MTAFFRARLVGGALLSSLALFIPACTSAAGDDGAAADEDLRLHPTGTETMSTLIVQLPTGTCLPGGSCTRPLAAQPQITLDGASMTLGTGLRVLPGSHKLSVGPTQTTITLDAGKTRTMTLPVVKRVCTNGAAATVPDTQFGRVPTLHYAACPTVATVDGTPLGGGLTFSSYYMYTGTGCGGSYLGNISTSYTCSGLSKNAYTVASVMNPSTSVCYNIPATEWQSLCYAFESSNAAGLGVSSPFPDGNVAVVPGTYVFTVEASGGTTTDTRTVAEGDAKDLAFTLPQLGSIPSTWNTNLTFADARELPDAATGTITSSCERNYSIPSSASGTVGLKAFTFPECSYTLNVGGRTVALNQTSSNDITLHRVDVDDVTVTREDGSTYTTKGTYEIYFGGNRIAGPYNTTSGIDLLSGAYEIVVKYNTAEGQKTNTYDQTL